jgi:hypothetical protein
MFLEICLIFSKNHSNCQEGQNLFKSFYKFGAFKPVLYEFCKLKVGFA